MPLYSYKQSEPKLQDSTYIAPGAQVIGDITLGADSSVWHNCVLRGDVNSITIGSKTNIQDLSMLHVTEESALVLGNNITIGHSVTLHACTIGDFALIGMGATVLDMATIGHHSIVAAGSVVTPGKSFPANSMIMGAPAKVVRELTTEEIKMLEHHYLTYVDYAKSFNDPRIVRELN